MLEEWIMKIEMINKPISLKPTLLLSIRENCENAFLYDYNMVFEEFDFFQDLSPQL